MNTTSCKKSVKRERRIARTYRFPESFAKELQSLADTSQLAEPGKGNVTRMIVFTISKAFGLKA